MASLQLEKINKHFGAVHALRDISLEIRDGEFVVFVGPSGCGKSTLLRTIAGLEEADSGVLKIGDADVTDAEPSDRDLAMVFQSYALYPHMTVRKNMEFGLKVANIAEDEREQRIAKAADVLQLTDYLERKPAQLSGGQRQRVAIGRAIVKNPKVFLFDEPLSNLDAQLRVRMRVELEALHNKLGTTMIYVTHDQVEAMTMADQIVVLRDGVVEQAGAPLELYRNPKTRFVAGFIGSPAMNIVAIDKLPAQSGLPVKEGVQEVGFRPEHVQIGATGQDAITATVVVKEELGSESYLYLHTDEQVELVAKIDGEREMEIGSKVGVRIVADKLYQFDRDGHVLGSAS